jgi:putative hydrolase of the HAD superfamily
MSLARAARCVIFDMDGVLAQLDRARRLAFLSAKLELPVVHLQQQIWDSDFEVNAEAGAFDNGAGYLAEFNRRLNRSLNQRLSREDWIEARRCAMAVSSRTLELAQRVAQRSQLAMLTNNGWLLKESLPQVVPEIVAVFGASAHASCEFGARKPQRAVFERILARYDVEPAQSVFIDDEPENVTAANALGMTAIQYVGDSPLERRLLELGLI